MVVFGIKNCDLFFNLEYEAKDTSFRVKINYFLGQKSQFWT
jgi:hypothetical protein